MNFVHPRAMKLLWLALLLLVSVFAIFFRFSTDSGLAASWQGNETTLWQDVAQAELNGVSGERWVQPLAARGVRLNRTALAQLLATAPVERTPAAQEKQVVISIPMPDGRMGRFRFVESSIMEPGLAMQFPELKTYYGQGLDDPTASVRFDLTPVGFHAIILSAGTTIYVDPLARGNADYYVVT